MQDRCAFDKVRDNFSAYIKTAFRTQFSSFESEREDRCAEPLPIILGIFYQDPWVERSAVCYGEGS